VTDSASTLPSRSEGSDEERWLPVAGTDGRYDVSSHGRVRSWTRGSPTVLTGTVTGGGHRAVGITPVAGGRARTELVHLLVARTFLGDPPSADCAAVRHLDGDKLNNRVDNLAWGSRSESLLDGARGRRARLDALVYPPPPEPAKLEGGRYAGRTADAGLVRTCLRLYDGGHITLRVMARILDCSEDVAANIVAGRTHRAVVGEERRTSPRRTVARRHEIEALIARGLTREEVNRRLDESLTHQAFYYYKSKVRP
jgi:hypothetical protein